MLASAAPQLGVLIPSARLRIADLVVLYVDDEAVNRNVGRRMLQHMGCRSVILEDGVEVEPALMAPGAHFDVLLLDIQMRQINGDVVCQHLRSRGYDDMPIIALTGT